MRFNIQLKEQYKAIAAYTGYILILVSMLELSPVLITFFYPGELVHAFGFLIPAVSLLVIGIVLWILFRSSRSTVLTVTEGGVIVLFCWIITFIFSALPFIILSGLNFTQAIFESVSGWTTTGLSVIDIAKAPYCILFWRSAMQFAGGAGLVIIMLSAVAGPTGPGLSIAEGRGDQLVPNIRRSANLVLKLYLTYAISGIIAYYLAGMSLFDAVNHCFAAISTGGFSTQPANIGYWDSPPIEIISCVLMILGNLNFVTAYLIYRRQFHCVLRNGELHVFWFALPLAFVILLFGVTIPTYSILSKSIRVALFEVVSALTTTGFSTVTYNSWSHLGFLVLTLLMLIGGGTFSTAGGIKQYRIHILFKSFQWNLKQAFLPRTAILDKSVWMGEMKKTVSDQHVAQVSTFIFLYLSTYFIGVGILASLGYSLHDSLFEFASALGTVGISTGITQASSPPILLWSESIAMFLGRLEFFVVIVSIIKLIQDFISFFRTR